MRTLQMILISLVSCLVFFGLAVAGFGGPAAYFSHPPLVALAVAGAVMFVVAMFSQGNISSGVREDRGNRWVLWAFLVLGLLSAYLPPFTDSHNILVVDGDTVRWIGVVVTVLGGVLRIWPVFVLGKRFSGLVAIQPGHTLVTDGIYSVIRHPSYLGLLLTLLGWALAFRSLVGVLIAALALVPLVGRIRAEERLLQSQFGAEYDAFRARTKWRLIPGIY